MPEGDSLRRAADRMRVLEGQVVSVETPHPRAALLGLADRLDGKRLERVEAVGKNLLLTFEGGLVLRSHLRMKGRWHVRRAEEKLIGRPWLVLRGDEWKAVQWNGPVLELGSRMPVPIRGLGPDIMDAPPDVDGMVERLRATTRAERSGRRSSISGSSRGSGTCGRPRPSGWRGFPHGRRFAPSRTTSSGDSLRLRPG